MTGRFMIGQRLAVGILVLMAYACPGAAWAHSSSNSYLNLTAADRDISVEWAIALRDLDYAIGLDANDDGDISWGELKAASSQIDAYALAHLTLSDSGGTCVPGPVEQLAELHSDGGYAVLRFHETCPAAVTRLKVDYALFFDRDPQHRGLLNLKIGSTIHAAALSPSQPVLTFDAGGSLGDTFREFFATGVDHLLSGIDHLLFVSMLLVPAMFRRQPDQFATRSHWVAVDRFWPAFIETIKVLSAFTVAHACTLTSAALGYIHLPSQMIEAGIAVTIFLTAIDNVWHILPGRRWILAFGFGLIHGFGFANALGPLALPPAQLAVALLSFNLGLEAAQIGVASIVLPLGFLARYTWAYRARFLPAVSGAVALIAFAWFTDRVSGIGFMPF